MAKSRWFASCTAIVLMAGVLVTVSPFGPQMSTAQAVCPWSGSGFEVIGPITISLPPGGDAPVTDPAYEIVPSKDDAGASVVVVSVRRSSEGLLEPFPLTDPVPHRIVDCSPGEPGAEPEYWLAVIEPIPMIGLPNPASMYCVERGGRIENRQGPGGQTGYCVFPNGTECPEWDFYEGTCGLPISGMHNRVEWSLFGIDCDTLALWGFTSEMERVGEGVYDNRTTPTSRPRGVTGNWKEYEGAEWQDVWDLSSRRLAETDLSGVLPEYLPYGINLTPGSHAQLNGWAYKIEERLAWRRIQSGRTTEHRYGWRLTNAEEILEDYGDGVSARTPVGELFAVYDEPTGLLVEVWFPQQLFADGTFLTDRFKRTTVTEPAFAGTQSVHTHIGPQTCGVTPPEPGSFTITTPADGETLNSGTTGFSSITLGWDDAPGDVALEGYQLLIRHNGRQILDETTLTSSYELVPFDSLSILPQGTYRVEVLVHDALPPGGNRVPYRDEIEFTIVNPPTLLAATGFAPANPACPDDPVTLTAAAVDPDGDHLSYRWRIDGTAATSLNDLGTWTWHDDPATPTDLDWTATVSVDVDDGHGGLVTAEFTPPVRSRLSTAWVAAFVDAATVSFSASLDDRPVEGLEIYLDGAPWKGGAFTGADGSLLIDLTGSRDVAGEHTWSAMSCDREINTGTFTIEPPIEICFDRVDNDFDGDTDADDLDCGRHVEVETFMGNAPADAGYRYLLGFVVTNREGPVAGVQMKLATDPEATDPVAFVDCGPTSDTSGSVACGWNSDLPPEGFAWRATSRVGTIWFDTLSPQVVDLSTLLAGVTGEVSISGRHGTTIAATAPERMTILGDGRYRWSGAGNDGYFAVEAGEAIDLVLTAMGQQTSYEDAWYLISAITPAADPCAGDPGGLPCFWKYLDEQATYGVIITTVNDDGSLGADVSDLALAFRIYTAWKLQQGFFGTGAYHWERSFGFDAIVDDDGDPVLDTEGNPTYANSYPLLTARRKAILDAMSSYIEGRRLEHGIDIDLRLFSISVTTVDDLYGLICDVVYNCGFDQQTSEKLFADSTMDFSKEVGQEIVVVEGKRALAKWLQAETRRGVTASAARVVVGNPERALTAAVKPTDIITPASIARTLAAYAIGHTLQMSDFSYFADMLEISANNAFNYATDALPAGSLEHEAVRLDTHTNLFAALKSLQEHYLYSKGFWDFANQHWLSYDPSGTYIDAPGKLSQATDNYEMALKWVSEFEQDFYLGPLEELVAGRGWRLLGQPRTVATAHSPVHLHVYDSAGHHCGVLEAGGFECTIPSAAHSGPFTEPQQITLTGTSTYRFELAAVENGTFGLDITAEVGGAPHRLEFTDVPVTSGSRALVEVEVGGAVPDLRLDSDGDGSFETVLVGELRLLVPITGTTEAAGGPPVWLGGVVLAGLLIAVGWWWRRRRADLSRHARGDEHQQIPTKIAVGG